MAVHAIKQTPEPRSAERAALAHAIESRAEAERAVEAGRAAVARASSLVKEAEKKLAAANVAVAAAKEANIEAMASALAQNAPVPASELRSARAVQADAVDDCDASKAALAQLQLEAASADEASRAADVRVEAAINSVLAGRALQFVQDLAARRSQILELLANLCFIHDRGGSRRGEIFTPIRELSEPLAAVAPEIDGAIGIGVTYQDLQAARAHPALEAWQEACFALKTDAGARLPTSSPEDDDA